MAPTQEAVLGQYRDGVDAIQRITSTFDDSDWQRPACGIWSATETARHVLSVVGWYHDWLDRAVAGDATPPFPYDQLASQTALALVTMADLKGPTAVDRFVDEADRYRDRLDTEWDTAYGYPAGSVTAGLHAGVAAAEWHLHAWDLSDPGERHCPSDPSGLFHAVAACVAATGAPLRGAALRLATPLGRRARPWPTMLARSGRSNG